MRSTTFLFAAAMLSTALPGLASETFRNGQSLYGQPAQQAQVSAVRTVDIAAARHLNVAYGETVTFRNEGKEFTWTFNGLDRRAVDLAKFAPPGFTSKPFLVHVAQNPLTRR